MKPLYIGFTKSKKFILSSSQEAISIHPNFERNLSENGIQTYLQYGFFPDINCIFKNIFSCPQGHLWEIVYDFEVSEINSKLIKDFSLNEKNLKKEYKFKTEQIFSEKKFFKIFDKVCNYRLLSDVPCALLLSGGIDSSLVAWTYAKRLNKKIPCYTLAFEGENVENELDIALETSRVLNLEHNIVKFNYETIDKLFLIKENLDQPFIDNAIIPLSIISEEISKSYKVAISADGGDEIFGGYPKYKRSLRNLNFLKKFEFLKIFSNNLIKKSSFIPNKLYKILCAVSKSDKLINSIYYSQHMVMNYSIINKVLQNNIYPFEDDFLIEFFNFLPELTQIQMMDINFYLKGDILYKSDMASMSKGLEIREPFLDQEIVNYGLSLKESEKINQYQKSCLRKLISKLLPHVAYQKKKGFEIPLNILNKSHFMQDSISDIINKNSLLWEYLDKKQVRKLIYSNKLNSYNNWQLRSLLAWCNSKNI